MRNYCGGQYTGAPEKVLYDHLACKSGAMKSYTGVPIEEQKGLHTLAAAQGLSTTVVLIKTLQRWAAKVGSDTHSTVQIHCPLCFG